MAGPRSPMTPPIPSVAGRALHFVDNLLHKALDGDLPKLSTNEAIARPDQSTILKHIPEKEFLAQVAPKDVSHAPLPSFDPGVFDNELIKLKLFATVDDDGVVNEPEGNVTKGTYVGTQVALTQAYQKIEQTYVLEPDPALNLKWRSLSLLDSLHSLMFLASSQLFLVS